jgi:hypothetical protein
MANGHPNRGNAILVVWCLMMCVVVAVGQDAQRKVDHTTGVCK